MIDGNAHIYSVELQTKEVANDNYCMVCGSALVEGVSEGERDGTYMLTTIVKLPRQAEMCCDITMHPVCAYKLANSLLAVLPPIASNSPKAMFR